MTDEIFMMTVESICNHIHKKSTPTFIEQLLEESLDLIKRQQAEIKQLRGPTKMIKAEAISEFAERLTDRIADAMDRSHDNPNGNNYDLTDVFDTIHNLVKELTEGK